MKIVEFYPFSLVENQMWVTVHIAGFLLYSCICPCLSVGPGCVDTE